MEVEVRLMMEKKQESPWQGKEGGGNRKFSFFILRAEAFVSGGLRLPGEEERKKSPREKERGNGVGGSRQQPSSYNNNNKGE